jgi:hypothetical protein
MVFASVAIPKVILFKFFSFSKELQAII